MGELRRQWEGWVPIICKYTATHWLSCAHLVYAVLTHHVKHVDSTIFVSNLHECIVPGGDTYTRGAAVQLEEAGAGCHVPHTHESILGSSDEAVAVGEEGHTLHCTCVRFGDGEAQRTTFWRLPCGLYVLSFKIKLFPVGEGGEEGGRVIITAVPSGYAATHVSPDCVIEVAP